MKWLRPQKLCYSLLTLRFAGWSKVIVFQPGLAVADTAFRI